MRSKHRIIIVLLIITSSGGAEHGTGESAAGLAINSTVAALPLPKKIAGLKNNQVAIPGGKNALPTPIDAMELIDPKASEQVLELIVKIAQHPATWKQIHRVLETLEANNAAYSQRIDSTRSELGWINKRLDRPGDKRNDVPDEKVAILPNATGTSSLETTFQRWRNVLFATPVPKEQLAIHPQLKVSEMQLTDAGEPKIEPIVNESPPLPMSLIQPEQFRVEKKFEERLNEIEDELKKLTKLSRMMPLRLKQLTAIAGHRQEKKAKSTKHLSRNITNYNQSDSLTLVSKSHPKFQYHKVHNTTIQNSGTSSLLGPNFWKKIASLKHNNGSNPTSRRNSFVAVSISPSTNSDTSKMEESLTHLGQYGMLATEPMKPEFTKPCKKNRNIRKQKQRSQPGRHPAVIRHDDENLNAKK